MANSNLNLTITNGPKSGETLACNPKTLIRIGRVIKGNTLAIKDPSISQQHLTIQFIPEIARWVLTDLNSSNGTFINGSILSPHKPHSLSHNDIIKIGEKTSFSVKISDGNEGARGRKGERRDLSAKDEILEPLVAKRRVTRSSALVKKNDRVEEEVEDNLENAGVEEDCVRVEEVDDDMNTMTLGEWFDRMEEYLPKAINKAAEEVIDKLMEKARFFDEYVNQTWNV